MSTFQERWLHRLSRASVHVFIALFGVLGFTPWSTGSFHQAGVFGTVESIALIFLGVFGTVASMRDNTLSEILALRGESFLFLIIAIAAVSLLIATDFTQWQGVLVYLALAASLGSRSLSLTRALRLVVEVRRD